MILQGAGDPVRSKTMPPVLLKDIIAQNTNDIMKTRMEALDVELAGPITKQQSNIFVAQSGSGKSLAAFCIAWKETKERKFAQTIYLDFDNPANHYKDRYSNFEQLPNLAYIIEEDFIKKPYFKDLEGSTPKEKVWAMLEDLASNPPDDDWLLVIDSLQTFCDYNDLKVLKQFFNLCDKLTSAGFTIIILHHKSSKAEAPSFKGLSFIRDSADTMWEVVPVRGKAGIIANIKLVCTKSRSVISYDNFILSFDTDKGTVGYDQNVLFEDELSVKDAIIEFLTKNPDSNQSSILQAVKPLINIGEKRIRVVLEKLVGLHILTVTKGQRHTKIYNITSTDATT